MYIVDLPISVPVGKNKKFSLNLNEYRNAHYYTLNTAKQEFTKMVSPLLQGIPLLQTIKLIYTLYPKTRRETDVANFCSIVDKFFCDTMVANGLIIDDNYHILPHVTYRFGGIDKTNPRVEVRIVQVSDLDEELDPPKGIPAMQITLNQDEILAALEQYVRQQITIASNQKIEIDLRAGRGENGFTATLDIRPMAVSSKPVLRDTRSMTAPVEEVEEAPQPETKAEDQPVAPVEEEAVEATPSDEDKAKRSSIFNFAKAAAE